MGGNVKLIVQDENGEVFVSYPNKTFLPELIIHNDLNSEDSQIRNKRCEEIKNKCLEYHKELIEDGDEFSLSLLKNCKYKTPDWYGICFISFKEMILLNIQDGSSITMVTDSEYISSPYERKAIEEFKISFKHEKSWYKLKYHPQWIVIENNLTKKHINKAKVLMELCGISFSKKEEDLWKDFINQD